MGGTTTVLAMPYPVSTDTPDVPRDVLALANRIEALWAPSWSTYTPTWTAATLAPSLGNGTLAGRYKLVGKRCDFWVWLLFGSTTNGGQGNYSFSLPPSIVPLTSAGEQWGICKGWAFNAGGNFAGLTLCSSTGFVPYLPNSTSNTALNIARNTDASGAAGTSIPVAAGAFAFSSGSNIQCSGSFETT